VQPARPDPEYARRAAPQPLDPYGRTSPRNIADEDLLDIPAFLRRSAN
jgi:cell division protein FtsZ